MTKNNLVELKYEDLINGSDLSDKILEAFGLEGLGALTISGIPNYVEYRNTLLPLSHKFAGADVGENNLTDEDKIKLEHKESMYHVGWSFGKEKLGDTPDLAKGSFYANPCHDKPEMNEEEKSLKTRRLVSLILEIKYPWAAPENIWPQEKLPELEPAFKQLGSLMVDVVVLLSKQIDLAISKMVPTYEKDTLFKALRNSKKYKGRLLYYFPVKEKTAKEGGWIGWHNDSGFLTALTSALFFDHDTGKIVPNPDPDGGLYIVDRSGENVHAHIPPDHLGVQCGECLQIISGGKLVATPHSVQPSRSLPSADGKIKKIGRGTFPVFVSTPVTFRLNPPPQVPREKVFDHTPHSKVPPLKERWTQDGITYGEFLGDSFKKYYEWNLKN